MDTGDLTIKTSRDGAVCTLILTGDLDFCAASGFLQHAARAIDDQTERFVLDLAGVTFLDCAGVRALAIATCFAPRGCPVVVRSLSPAAHRTIALVGLDLETFRELNPDLGPDAGQWDHVTSEREPAQVEQAESALDA
jgi:anti-anti-sigma factor